MLINSAIRNAQMLGGHFVWCKHAQRINQFPAPNNAKSAPVGISGFTVGDAQDADSAASLRRGADEAAGA